MYVRNGETEFEGRQVDFLSFEIPASRPRPNTRGHNFSSRATCSLDVSVHFLNLAMDCCRN